MAIKKTYWLEVIDDDGVKTMYEYDNKLELFANVQKNDDLDITFGYGSGGRDGFNLFAQYIAIQQILNGKQKSLIKDIQTDLYKKINLDSTITV